MEELSIEERIEIVVAVQARIASLKDFIATAKLLGFDPTNYEKSLSTCETIIKQKKMGY